MPTGITARDNGNYYNETSKRDYPLAKPYFCGCLHGVWDWSTANGRLLNDAFYFPAALPKSHAETDGKDTNPNGQDQPTGHESESDGQCNDAKNRQERRHDQRDDEQVDHVPGTFDGRHEDDIDAFEEWINCNESQEYQRHVAERTDFDRVAEFRNISTQYL